MQALRPALASEEFALAGRVDEAGVVTVWWGGPSVMGEVVGVDRSADDVLPPPLPFVGGLRRLIGRASCRERVFITV